MLYFSKFRIILISLFTLIFVYLTSSNFIKIDDNWIDKKINLGLDLQGGSYLLLEIDNQPVIVQKLQNLRVIRFQSFIKVERLIKMIVYLSLLMRTSLNPLKRVIPH